MQKSITQWVDFDNNEFITKKKINKWMKNEGYATKVTPDDDFDLGRECTTFSHIPDSQIPFLKYVHSLEQPHILEFGASEGMMVWKTLLAGGRVLANDLYENQVQKAYNFSSDKIFLTKWII